MKRTPLWKLLAITWIVWLVLVSLSIGAVYDALQIKKFRKLQQEGVQTTGTVLSKEPENHRSVKYRYIVEGKAFERVGVPGNGTPAFSDLAAGDQVLVTFDPLDPDISVLGEADPIYRQRILVIEFLACGLFVGCLVVTAVICFMH
jgi:hypothetical protein